MLKQGDIISRLAHPNEKYVVTLVKEETVVARSLRIKTKASWEFWKKDIQKENEK